ncbi:MAG: hypothetical protein K6C32_01865, partial [Bacilli bacterium]|nr:hypothetical protein [Bacilli bacterium]
MKKRLKLLYKEHTLYCIYILFALITSIIALVMGINYLSRRDKCNVIRSEVVEVNEKEYTDGTKEMDFTIESH